MTQSSSLEQRLRQYLLGQLDDHACGQLEKELLTGDDVFEELLIIEDEITDEFIAGELNPTDRAAFEKHFLITPERRDGLSFARTLQNRIATTPHHEKAIPKMWPGFFYKPPVAVRTTLVAVIVAIVAATVWLLSNQKPSPQTFATLTLTMSQTTRSDGSQASKVRLPLSESGLRIVMVLPATSSTGDRYRAEIENGFGEIRKAEATLLDERSVAITLPAEELKRGPYSIKLVVRRPDGVEQRISGNYLFTAE